MASKVKDEPGVGEFVFISEGPGGGAIVPVGEGETAGSVQQGLAPKPFPEALLQLSEERKEGLLNWLDENLRWLKDAQSRKQNIWADYEIAYRAYPEAYKTTPFEGASNLVVPVIAMAVDP